MATPIPREVFSHWSKLVENFQTSTLDFYTAVEAALARRAVPGLTMSRVDWKEGGVLTANREYLRIERDRRTFDVCAAPFGTGYFFSWWVVEKRPWRSLLYAILLLVLIVSLVRSWTVRRIYSDFVTFLFHTIGGLAVPIIYGSGILLGLALLILIVRVGGPGLEFAFLAVPIVGPLYGRIFKPVTYYRIDTTLMFQETVRAAVNEVIDSLTTAKGIRALTDEERKPVMREFFGR